MASPEDEEGSTVLPRVCEFLLPFYRKCFSSCQTPFQAHKEGSEVEMGGGGTKDVRRDQDPRNVLTHTMFR